MGMLEASNQNSVDAVSQFLGTIVDRHCGCYEGNPITTVFKKYNDVVHQIYKENATLSFCITMDLSNFRKHGREQAVISGDNSNGYELSSTEIRQKMGKVKLEC